MKKSRRRKLIFPGLKTRLIGRVFSSFFFRDYSYSGICRGRVHAIRWWGWRIIIDAGPSRSSRVECDRENKDDQSDQDRYKEKDQQRRYDDYVKQGAIAESGTLQNYLTGVCGRRLFALDNNLSTGRNKPRKLSKL
jgi:hypothetical protein